MRKENECTIALSRTRLFSDNDIKKLLLSFKKTTARHFSPTQFSDFSPACMKYTHY